MSIFKSIYSEKFTTLMGDDNTVLSKFTNLSPYLGEKGDTLRLPQINYRPTLLKGLTQNNNFDSVHMSEGEQVLSMTRYYITPLEISGYETIFENYDKVSGIATNLATASADDMTTDILITVAGQVDTTRIISTSGSNGIANTPDGVSAKKSITLKDISKLRTRMDIDKVKKDNRFLLLHPIQIDELQFSAENIEYNRIDFNQNGLASGVCAMVAGIGIISRAEIPVLDGTSGNILPRGATYDNNDVFVGIAFQSDEVGYTLGNTKTKIEDNQIKYATILTFEGYALAGSLRASGSRQGLYYIKQG